MALELLANVFVFASDDPARRAKLLEAMRASGGFSSVYQDGRWCVGEAAFPVGPRQPAEAAPHGLLLTQAPDSLYGSSGELSRLADLLVRGQESVGSIAGDVGAVRLDGAAAHLMRPAAGRVPWYYTVGAAECAAGTRLAYFHHLLGMTAIDEFVHATLAGAQVFPDQRTPLAGVKLLAPGHVVTLRPTVQPKPVAYWHPFAVVRERPTDASIAAHAAELRTCLVAALERELDGEGGNLLGLSGGVDSSTLAALAVRVAGRPIATFSHVPPDGDSLLLHTLEYIQPLVDELGIDSTLVPLTARSYLEAQWTAPRVGFAVPHQALGHLAEFVDSGGWTVLTGGELADDLVGGDHFLPFDWLASFSPLQMAGRMRRPGMLNRRRRSVLHMWADVRWRRLAGRPALPVEVDLPSFVLDEHRQEYAAWRSAFARRIARVGHPYPRLQAMLECDMWQVMNWEACSALGVRRSIPFVTRDVIELAVACHPQEHAEPSKRLMRIGLRDDVPLRNLDRPDKGIAGGEMDDDTLPWEWGIPDRLGGIVRADWLKAPPERLSFDDASSLLGLLLGTEAPVLVPTRLRAEADRDA